MNAFRLSPRPVGVVIRATLLDFANRRYLWWVFGGALLLVIGLAVVGRWFPMEGLTAQEKARTFAAGGGELFVDVVIILIGWAVIRPEIDSGAAALALTRPVSHAEYLLGRYLGGVVLLVGSLAILAAGSLAVVAAANGSVDLTLLYGFVALAMNACVILALMTVLAIAAGAIGAVIIGFIVFRVSVSIPTVEAFVTADVVTGFGAGILRIFAVVMPHMIPSPITAGQETYITDSVSITIRGPLWYDWAWALAWIAGCLTLAVVEMRRREL